MKWILFLFLVSLALSPLKAQLRFTNDTISLLSTADSATFTYIYPVFQFEQQPKYAEQMNHLVQETLLPSPEVLKKMEQITSAVSAAVKNKEKQTIKMQVSYKNDLLVCLQTDIDVHVPGAVYAVGDMFFDTYSIASGNKYDIKNLFTPAVYDTLFVRHAQTLFAAGVHRDDLLEQVIGFGLIEADEQDCNNCLVLEMILKDFYADAGPMLFELKMEDVQACINADGPLKDLLKK